MTPRELEVLDFVRELIAAAGVTPTVREVARHMRTGPGGAARLLDSLVAQGALEKDAGRQRGLRLAGMPDLRAVPTATISAELARRGVTLAALDPRPRTAVGHEPTCAADSCGNAVQRGHLMCLPHWFALPPELRTRILRTNSARDRHGLERAVTQARDLIDGGEWRREA